MAFTIAISKSYKKKKNIQPNSKSLFFQKLIRNNSGKKKKSDLEFAVDLRKANLSRILERAISFPKALKCPHSTNTSVINQEEENKKNPN